MTTRGTYGILWLGWFVVLLYQIWPTDFQQNLKADQPSLRLFHFCWMVCSLTATPKGCNVASTNQGSTVKLRSHPW
jgi:hypothetical protein